MSRVIELKQVTKVYQSGKEKVVALKDVTFSVKENEYAVLIGPSGSGKSTLIHIAGGLELPTKGSVLYKRTNIYRMKDTLISKWRNRTVGFVFQFYHLIEELSVKENIALPAFLIFRERKTAFKKVEEMLQYLGIEDKGKSFPSELSGGQRQKVAIARALINDPEIIFCDEPTGNLDRESAQKVIDLLALLHRERKKTIIVVTHNREIAQGAERVFHLSGGELINTDSTD